MDGSTLANRYQVLEELGSLSTCETAYLANELSLNDPVQ